MQIFETDVVIVGGGIAGLWTQALLGKTGCRSIILEQHSLGQAQTLASQGMIHGGQRYLLAGRDNPHAASLTAMPERWQSCLTGAGELDLRQVEVLARAQYLWSPGGLADNVASFFASQALHSRVIRVPAAEFPEVFQIAPRFRGRVYRLDEWSVDTNSLVSRLRELCGDTVFRGRVERVMGTSEQVKGLQVRAAEGELTVRAQRYVFTAGLGNELVVRDLGLDYRGAVTQRRPLRQILVRDVAYPLYGHCLTTDPRPRVTISAHPCGRGRFIWYLGGLVAERCVGETRAAALAFARREMETLFPWLPWRGLSWATVDIERAEPFAGSGHFRPGPQLQTYGNLALGWPTKMTLAPALARQICDWLQLASPAAEAITSKVPLSPAPVGRQPWESVAWQVL